MAFHQTASSICSTSSAHLQLRFGMLQNVGCRVWLPKPFEAPQLQVGLATVLGASQLRKFAEFSLSRQECRMLPSPIPSRPQRV